MSLTNIAYQTVLDKSGSRLIAILWVPILVPILWYISKHLEAMEEEFRDAAQLELDEFTSREST